MIASDFMVKPVIKAMEGDDVRSVLDKMVSHRISGLPVVNHRNEVTGYISDGDIMKRLGKQSTIVLESIVFSAVFRDEQDLGTKFRCLAEENVMKVATHHVITVPDTAEVSDIAALLGRKRIKKVPVVRNGILVGIISRGDVIRAVSKYYLTGAE